MPNAAILGHLGLFVRRHFLTAKTCAEIRSEMATVARRPAMVRPHGKPGGALDDKTRRTGIASVSTATNALVEDRLRAIQPALEQHFQVQLAGQQGLSFYIYEEGDFFAAHQDADAYDPIAPDWVRKRQVSVSILLNHGLGIADAEAYGGGELIFHGRRTDRIGTGFSIPLEGEEGMFIAFPADWMHEVRPVTSGRRYSIVTWFV